METPKVGSIIRILEVENKKKEIPTKTVRVGDTTYSTSKKTTSVSIPNTITIKVKEKSDNGYFAELGKYKNGKFEGSGEMRLFSKDYLRRLGKLIL